MKCKSIFACQWSLTWFGFYEKNTKVVKEIKGKNKAGAYINGSFTGLSHELSGCKSNWNLHFTCSQHNWSPCTAGVDLEISIKCPGKFSLTFEKSWCNSTLYSVLQSFLADTCSSLLYHKCSITHPLFIQFEQGVPDLWGVWGQAKAV